MAAPDGGLRTHASPTQDAPRRRRDARHGGAAPRPSCRGGGRAGSPFRLRRRRPRRSRDRRARGGPRRRAGRGHGQRPVRRRGRPQRRGRPGLVPGHRRRAGHQRGRRRGRRGRCVRLARSPRPTSTGTAVPTSRSVSRSTASAPRRFAGAVNVLYGSASRSDGDRRPARGRRTCSPTIQRRAMASDRASPPAISTAMATRTSRSASRARVSGWAWRPGW